MDFHTLLTDTLRPCSFCNVYLPFRYRTSPISRWPAALSLIPYDETVFSVDREVAEFGVHTVLDKFFERIQKIRKVQCICNYGQHFHFERIQHSFINFTHLNLCGMVLSHIDIVVLAESYNKIEEVVLKVDETVKCDVLKSLYKVNPLRHIFIINHKPDKLCDCLIAVPDQISYFSLCNCTYPRDLINYMRGWDYLNRIRLENCQTMPDNFFLDALNNKQDIEIFQFNFHYEMQVVNIPDCLEFVSDIKFLTLLNNVIVTNNMVRAICTNCEQLEYLLIGHLDIHPGYENNRPEYLFELNISAENISQLSKLKNLRCLGLFGLHSNERSNSYLRGLRRCVNLETLCLTTRGMNVTDIGCLMITRCKKLTRLILMGYHFTVEDLRFLRDTLAEREPGEYRHDVQRPPIQLFVPQGCITQMDIDAYPHFLLTVYKGIPNDMLIELQNTYM